MLLRVSLINESFISDTPLEHSYTNQKVHPDDDIGISEDDLYTLASQTQSNPSVWEHPWFLQWSNNAWTHR